MLQPEYDFPLLQVLILPSEPLHGDLLVRLLVHQEYDVAVREQLRVSLLLFEFGVINIIANLQRLKVLVAVHLQAVVHAQILLQHIDVQIKVLVLARANGYLIQVADRVPDRARLIRRYDLEVRPVARLFLQTQLSAAELVGQDIDIECQVGVGVDVLQLNALTVEALLVKLNLLLVAVFQLLLLDSEFQVFEFLIDNGLVLLQRGVWLFDCIGWLRRLDEAL